MIYKKYNIPGFESVVGILTEGDGFDVPPIIVYTYAADKKVLLSEEDIDDIARSSGGIPITTIRYDELANLVVEKFEAFQRIMHPNDK